MKGLVSVACRRSARTARYIHNWHSNNGPETIRPRVHLSRAFSSFNLNNKNESKIAIAMSGGVDSSVVAYLLSQQYPIENLLGIHMSNWEYHQEDDNTQLKQQSKCWEQDWKDTQAVAQQLQIPVKHVSFEKDYWNEVFEPYCQMISSNATPNPDVDCNRKIKFGVLKEYLQQRYGISKLATGHYARIWNRSKDDGNSEGDPTQPPPCLQHAMDQDPTLEEYLMQSSTRYLPVLLAAKDKSKDQSYFLSNVPATSLTNVMFPLGDYFKTKNNLHLKEGPSSKDIENHSDHDVTVRELANRARLPNAAKRDSMGICFVGKRTHGAFLNEYIPPTTTNRMLQCINIEDGTVVASIDAQRHPSLMYATPGQGAKLSGASQKWFVVDKQQSDNTSTLLLCPGTHHPSLYSDTLFIDASQFHWILGGIPPPLPFRAKCRIRHLQPLATCDIDMLKEDNTTGGRRFYRVCLKSPLRGIARGQVCAIYAGEDDVVCLGGGPIADRGPSYWDLQQELPSFLHPSGHNDLSSGI